MKNDLFSKYRLGAMAIMVLATFLSTALVCLIQQFYSDEWFCVMFIDLVYLMVFFFEIEYERVHGKLLGNTQTSFRALASAQAVCCGLTVVLTLLPPFFQPVFLIPIVMSACSNDIIALSTGLYSCMIICLVQEGSYYELLGYLLMVLISTVLCKTLHEKRYRFYISFLFFCIPFLITCIFYYWTYGSITYIIYLYGFFTGVLTGCFVYTLYDRVRVAVAEQPRRQMENIIAPGYTRVLELKAYSMSEYHHAKLVSDLCSQCAELINLDHQLCAAAGFYYRMGKWVGEPHVENGVIRARQLCFPEELQQILAEYNGEQELPSTKESALVHMVDALVIRMEVMQDEISNSKWNRDMMIYQTLNDLTTSGIYDESGLSINEYLKVRDFLTKEVFVT